MDAKEEARLRRIEAAARKLPKDGYAVSARLQAALDDAPEPEWIGVDDDDDAVQ